MKNFIGFFFLFTSSLKSKFKRFKWAKNNQTQRNAVLEKDSGVFFLSSFSLFLYLQWH